MDIAPGTLVSIEVKAEPTNAAARKTLARLLRKDSKVANRLRWHDRHRPSHQTSRRGGRMWNHRMKSTPGVNLTAGSQYDVRTTVDVLRDLESIAKWVSVTPR